MALEEKILVSRSRSRVILGKVLKCPCGQQPQQQQQQQCEVQEEEVRLRGFGFVSFCFEPLCLVLFFMFSLVFFPFFFLEMLGSGRR